MDGYSEPRVFQTDSLLLYVCISKPSLPYCSLKVTIRRRSLTVRPTPESSRHHEHGLLRRSSLLDPHPHRVLRLPGRGVLTHETKAVLDPGDPPRRIHLPDYDVSGVDELLQKGTYTFQTRFRCLPPITFAIEKSADTLALDHASPLRRSSPRSSVTSSKPATLERPLPLSRTWVSGTTPAPLALTILVTLPYESY